MPTDDPFFDWYSSQNPFRFDDSFALSTPSAPLPGPFGDLFADVLEEEPEIPFQGALKRANLTPNQFQTFRNQREAITKQFQAQLDEQFRRGMLPTGTATDFFRNFDFGKEFQRFSPSQRIGSGSQRLSPLQIFTDRNRQR